MAQIVKAYAGETCSSEERLEALAYDVGRIEGGTDGAGEDEIRVLPEAIRRRYFCGLTLYVGFEGFDGDYSEPDRAAFLVFGRADDHARAVPRPLHLPSHREPASPEVHVLPSEAEQLGLAASAGDGQDVEGFQTVMLRRLEEPPDLFGSEGLDLPLTCTGQAGSVGDVVGN